jgi:predicted RNA-binding Zn-ribbon protein involved in translation (DUF1610 family)
MGVYSDYLSKNIDFNTLNTERKQWLRKIAELRGHRCILTYACDINKGGANTNIEYADILPFTDQISNCNGSNNVDIILETPGGQAEIVEEMVKAIRRRFSHVGIIIPGMAKSAGTIFAMAGDEILMGKNSALGPIDAQMIYPSTGKRFSADDLLDGLEKIKQEVLVTGKLNPTYIPILQNISPGEIQHCENAQAFSRKLVKEWLKDYKFSHWNIHKSTEKFVTKEEKEAKANEIASALCKHSEWLTHARSVKIDDLRKLGLEIIDYSEIPDLDDAINRYFTLLSIAFEKTNIFKIFETPESQIVKHIVKANIEQPMPLLKSSLAGPLKVETADVEFSCPGCKSKIRIQVNLNNHSDLKEGYLPYPVDNNIIQCPNCGRENNIMPIRLQIEAQTHKKIVK